MAAFFLIVVVFGSLPLRAKNFKKRPLLRAIGSTFAGCLFLNVALMHILPEAAATLEQYLKSKSEDEDQEVFPLAYLLVMVGFIITVFFTKVLAFHSHAEDHFEYSHDTQDYPNDSAPIGESDQQQDAPARGEPDNEGKSDNEIKKSLLTIAEAYFGENGEGSSNQPKTIAKPKNKTKSTHSHDHQHEDHNDHHDSHHDSHKQ
jgi:hypothetical protein